MSLAIRTGMAAPASSYSTLEIGVHQPPSQPVLAVERLRKVFIRGFRRKRTVAVDDISFSVQRGEIFGFLGPNGAGKTTTIKMLMGLLHPTSGVAEVMGRAAGQIAAKRLVGYLPENPYFYDYLTGAEYLHMVGRIYGMPGQTRRHRVDELLDRLGIAMAKHRPMRSYSKGMMQRVGLAQALVSDPELVVLDEPMSGLDPMGRREVREMIVDLRKAGKTVFFSTHILSDANLLCDRVAIIVKGKVQDVGPLGKLLDPKAHRIDVLWVGSSEAQSHLRQRHLGTHSSTSEGHVFSAGDQTSVDAFLRDAIAQGASILQITPHRETLEEVFLRGAEGPAEALRS